MLEWIHGGIGMIKIAFFDIDGTLSNMETRSVSDITIETLQRLQANNIKVCIATGRHPLSVPTFEGVTFDAILSFNGSIVLIRKDMFYIVILSHIKTY